MPKSISSKCDALLHLSQLRKPAELRRTARPGSAPSRAAARNAASGFCSSCSTTTTRRPNAAFFVCDAEARVIGCGRGSFELTGLKDEATLGRPVKEVLGPAGSPTDEDPIDTSLEWGVRVLGRAGAGRGRGRPAREGHRRRVPGLRRGRRPAAGPDAQAVMRLGLPAPGTASRIPPGTRVTADEMTSRRRNLFVILLMLGPPGRVGGRDRRPRRPGSASTSRAASSSSTRASRRRRARSRPRRSTARSTSSASASTSSASPSPRSSASAATRSRSACPGVKNLERAKKQVGTTAQLYFYDWEKNVIGNPQTPITGLYEAVKQASQQPPADRRQQHDQGPVLPVQAQPRRWPPGPDSLAQGPALASSTAASRRATRC